MAIGVSVPGVSVVVPGPSQGPVCIRCPQERLAGRNYCGACGSRLRPSCERKQVTVLFTDVCSFTDMSERLDPEDVHGIMEDTFDIVLDAVHEHGGTVNQFLGDGVMALFGDAPGEHHACRALRAALTAQERLEPMLREVRRRHGLDFRVRMAINTGPVVVGTIGAGLRTDYTAAGDTTSLAAGLLGIAAPGQIVLTGRTREHATGRFVVEELGETRLPGSREPTEAYALLRETWEYVGHGRLAEV